MRGEIKRKFTRFLINGDGEVVDRFEPNVDAMVDAIIDAVEALLPVEG